MSNENRDLPDESHPLSGIQRWCDTIAAGIARFSRVICALAMIAMAVGITVEIISRNFFHYSFRGVEELSGYLLVAITFLGLAVAVHEEGLFRVEILLERFPASVRKGLELLFLVAFAAFLLLIDYHCLSLVVGSWQNGYASSTLLATPLYLPQALIPLGLTFTLLLVVARFIRVAANSAAWLVADQDRSEP